MSPRSRQERTLATRKLPAGKYTLSVLVTDGKDRVRSVATTFEIAKEQATAEQALKARGATR